MHFLDDMIYGCLASYSFEAPLIFLRLVVGNARNRDTHLKEFATPPMKVGPEVVFSTARGDLDPADLSQ